MFPLRYIENQGAINGKDKQHQMEGSRAHRMLLLAEVAVRYVSCRVLTNCAGISDDAADFHKSEKCPKQAKKSKIRNKVRSFYGKAAHRMDQAHGDLAGKVKFFRPCLPL